MLVQGEFEPIGRGSREKIKNLSDIEIVGDREVLESLLHEQLRADRIGHIQGKVADHGEIIPAFEVTDAAKIANENAIWLCVFDDAEESALARFLDARSGKKKTRLWRSLTHLRDER